MPTQPLTKSESLMLDVVRVTAAALVAFGHLTQHFFSTGWLDLTFIARDAVAVFFVLSGFVIRHVTCKKPATFSRYLGDRASRIYSIAIPALLLTLLTDSIARHVNPGFYENWSSNYDHPLLRILKNLIFCGQLWTHTISPLSNSPYWSVNYEVAYYLFYGCAFYFVGTKRWFWIVVLCLLFGPRVLYLSPLWIAGCIIHDLYQRWNAAGTATVKINWLLFGCVLLLITIPPISRAYPALFDLSFYPRLSSMANNVGVRPPDYFFGLIWTVIFMRLLLFARKIAIKIDNLFVRSVHFISEGTFPIYLLHFPLYVLIAACIPYNHADPIPKIIIYLCVLVLGILAGHPGNILKYRIRELLFSTTWEEAKDSILRRVERSTP